MSRTYPNAGGVSKANRTSEHRGFIALIGKRGARAEAGIIKRERTHRASSEQPKKERPFQRYVLQCDKEEIDIN